jgi:Domain of unknown function (DUF4397)
MSPFPAGRIVAAGLVTLAALAAAPIAAPAGGAAPGPAPTAAGSTIRVAHFSPDTPPMDVYAAGFDGRETLVLPKLGFGQVSAYMALPGGTYAFSMRPAGAPPTSGAALRVSATLDDGVAYTFAAFGRSRSLETDLVTDDLSAPPAGQARVRLIQAAGDSGKVDVSAGSAPLVAHDAGLGSVGSYTPVTAGSIMVTASADEAPRVTQRLDLAPGTVNSVVVLDDPAAGGLQVVSLTDATGTAGTGAGAGGAQGMPAGGVDTGGGGAARERTAGLPVPALLALALGAVAAVTGGTALARASRRLVVSHRAIAR